MIVNARERLFWPHLNANLRQIRSQCKLCNQNAPSQPPEDLILTPDPELPFDQVAADQCKIGGHIYLIYADRFTGWTEVAKLPNESFKTVKKNPSSNGSQPSASLVRYQQMVGHPTTLMITTVFSKCGVYPSVNRLPITPKVMGEQR